MSLTTFHSVPAYSELYGIHPSRFKIYKNELQLVPPGLDPYTCKSPRIMAKRRMKIRLAKCDNYENRRCKMVMANDILSTHAQMSANALLSTRAEDECASALSHESEQHATEQLTTGTTTLPTLEDVASDVYERTLTSGTLHSDVATTGTVDVVCATRTPPAKSANKGRQGAKMVKNMERLNSPGHVLSPEEATMFRALSARANVLAQDRGDISFSGKELCREFAVPNRNSYARLKRVVRYLVGLPRLIYKFDYAEVCEYADVYSDTDFAGCKETRRSTSGGVIILGGHTVRHRSKTQTTIALSSGEAELLGIGSAIAEGLGFQSLARDMGWQYKIRVHSDATAAIGIARRRGLGKVRHLDVTDLWVQEKLRCKAVKLVKILGADNPADIFTKYVDRGILSKALKFMNLESREGRAKSAPLAMGV